MTRQYNYQFRYKASFIPATLQIVAISSMATITMSETLGMSSTVLIIGVFFILSLLYVITLRFIVFRRMLDVSQFYDIILSPTSITFIAFEGGTGMPYFGLRRPAKITTQHEWSSIDRITVIPGRWLNHLEIALKGGSTVEYSLSLSKYGISCMLADIKSSTDIPVDAGTMKQFKVRLPYSRFKDILISTGISTCNPTIVLIIIAIVWFGLH